MSWLYYVAIAFFFLYVMYSLYYMAKRTFSLRRQREQARRESLTVRQDPEMQSESIEQIIERGWEDGRAKALKLRNAMNSFDYEVYSEDTSIATASLVTQSFRDDGEDQDENVDCKKGRAKRTMLVLDTEIEEAIKSNARSKKCLPKGSSGRDTSRFSNGKGRAERTALALDAEIEEAITSPTTAKSKKCLQKGFSGGGSSKSSNDAESFRTVITSDTTIIPDGDESTDALSRKLDKEAGLEPLKCVICLEAYKYGQVICSAKIKSCGHIFHADCIQQWLKQNEECPLCRVKLIVPEAL